MPSARLALAALAMAAAACGGTLDGGSDIHGLLPVDERNPIILCNDGFHDNWQGEYAILLANAGGPALAGIVVNDSPPWPDIDANLSGWKQMVKAARDSGLQNIPEPVASVGAKLVRPSDGNIDATEPNGSVGANLIVDVSQRLSRPYRPVVVVTGGRLTDVADAYLVDPTLPDRIVVVSSLGTTTSGGGEMGVPNGEMDTWADVVVARKFRYIQVSAYYDQLTDVPSTLLSQLPDNPFKSWIASKQPNIWDDLLAADQVGVAAVAIPGFVSQVARVTQQGATSANYPALAFDAAGPDLLVTSSVGSLATARFWQILLDPATFRP